MWFIGGTTLKWPVRNRGRKATLTITGYGQDAVALSPEPEEGGISQVVPDGALRVSVKSKVGMDKFHHRSSPPLLATTIITCCLPSSLLNTTILVTSKTGVEVYMKELSPYNLETKVNTIFAKRDAQLDMRQTEREVDKADGNDVDCKIKNSATMLSHLMPSKFIFIVIFSPKKKQSLFAARPQLLPSPLFVAGVAVPGHHQDRNVSVCKPLDNTPIVGTSHMYRGISTIKGMFCTLDSSVSCCSKNVQLCLDVFQKYCKLCRGTSRGECGIIFNVICRTKDAQLYLDIFQKY
nr:hypothetical protein [Tanacetum cinerariifolium]